MKFTDLITLVKSGYSYDQVKELLSLTVESPESEKDNPESGAEGSVPETPDEPEQDAAAEPETKNYEDLYKTAQEELSKIKKDLADLQSRNRSRDNSGDKMSDEDIVMNFLNN